MKKIIKHVAIFLVLLTLASCTRVLSWRSGESSNIEYSDSLTILRPTRY